MGNIHVYSFTELAAMLKAECHFATQLTVSFFPLSHVNAAVSSTLT